MSVTLKALKEQAKELVFRYEDDISTIEALPDRDEIMVEYRKTLDASASIRAVSERHAALEQQRRLSEERQKKEEAEKQAADAVLQAAAESTAKALGTDPEAVQESQPQKTDEAADFQSSPKTYTCKFYAKGSIAQLKGLKEYMERNGIEYGNL